MEQLAGRSIAEMVEDLVHAETQVEEHSLVLTVDGIERIIDGPQLDFGGGEYEEAGTEVMEPQKRDPDDEYGWWQLDEGMYRVRFNESLALDDGVVGVLQPWWRAFSNGVTHPTQVVTGKHSELHMLLQVEDAGAEIKENARLTELRCYT
ncbi:MAG: dCTP deaminase [Candidatus Nanohaloarchaea archaeon]|nr:dCTP deaminase [Candidatus Nanohaloarchaea archaeon]